MIRLSIGLLMLMLMLRLRLRLTLLRCTILSTFIETLVQFVVLNRLLDFPNVLLCANREFQIFLGDRIPVLVDHHNSKQGANGAKEGTVDIMLDFITNIDRKDIQDDLTNNKEGDTKQNITQWPSIV